MQQASFRLSYGTTSPFVRKVTVMAHECGLHNQIERVDTLPWDAATEISAANPVGKVPALVTREGIAIYDSSTIVDFLDRQHSGEKRIPVSDPARSDALTRNALADGAMEAVILIFSELTRRPAEFKWDWWIERQATKVNRSLDAMEHHPSIIDTTQFDVGHMAMACCVGWIEFRVDVIGIDFRQGRPRLAAWFDAISERDSMKATMPVAHS